MATTSVLTSVCASNLLQTKSVQVYRSVPLPIPKSNGHQKPANMESICLAIVNTMANLYNVQSTEDYAHYVQQIAPMMLRKVRDHVTGGQPILMAILASQLSRYEGAPRDRALKREEDLARLDEVCKQISAIHSPGAKVAVVMDGLIHDDLFGIGHMEEWESIKAMQEVAGAQYYETLEVFPIWNVLIDDHDDIPLPQDEARYYFLHHAELLKEHLLKRFGSLDDISGLDLPSFKPKYRDKHYHRLCGAENEKVEDKVACRIQVLANILDSAFGAHVHVSL